MQVLSFHLKVCLLLCILTVTCFADEKTENHIKINMTHAFQLDQLLALNEQSYLTYSHQELLEPISIIKSEFNAGIFSLETSIVSSEQRGVENNYYVSSALTLHESSTFNIVLTASVEQKKQPYALYYHRALNPNNHISHDELNYRYGVIGSYAINSTWHFSGGILHSPTTNQYSIPHIYNNNIALIGTSYSF